MISRLPDEPKGWRKLQAQALKEGDPKKLDELIKRLNALVTEHEHRSNVSSVRQRADAVKETLLNL
jgi:hypothetical protein